MIGQDAVRYKRQISTHHNINISGRNKTLGDSGEMAALSPNMINNGAIELHQNGGGGFTRRVPGLQKRNSVFKMPKPQISRVEFNWENFETEFNQHIPFDCQAELIDGRRSGNRGVPVSGSPAGGLNASEGGNSISSMNYPPPQTVGFLGQVMFPTNNERDRYDTTYILIITHSGRAFVWSAKTDDRTGFVDLDDSKESSSRECCVCNFMQVEMLKCFFKPTDQAFVVFRAIDHTPETLGIDEKQRCEWKLQIMNLTSAGELIVHQKLSSDFVRLLKPEKFRATSIHVLEGWTPGKENFLCVWGEQETVKILDLHNHKLLNRRKQSHEAMHKINSLLSVRQGESCLFRNSTASTSSTAASSASHSAIHVLSFLIVTRCSNVDVPDQLVGIEICLDHGEGDFEMNAPPHYVEGSSEAKKIFQIADTHQFLLWQKESAPNDKHPPTDVLSVWIAKLNDIALSSAVQQQQQQQQQQPKAVRVREKDVRVGDLISGKEIGGVSKVVFHSYPDESEGARTRTMAIVMFHSSVQILLIEYVSSSADMIDYPRCRIVELFEKRDHIRLSLEASYLPTYKCLAVTVENRIPTSPESPPRYYTVLLERVPDHKAHSVAQNESDHNYTYEYVGVLPNADRKPLGPLLDMGDCGSVYMDVYDRVVHYKSVKNTTLLNLQIFSSFFADLGLTD